MVATAFSCMVLQLIPILVNPTNANLGGKITFIFSAPSLLMCIYLFCFPEMKGRNYLELEEMFQATLSARKFKKYVCVSNIYLNEVLEKSGGATEVENVDQLEESVRSS